MPFAIALERDGGQVAVYEVSLFPSGQRLDWDEANWFYVERLVKCLLWVKGGWKITTAGDAEVGRKLQAVYRAGGLREFDAEFMSRVYEREFTVEVVDWAELPQAYEKTEKVGGHLDGCRIGFDAGGSDRKVAAVMDGEVLFSDETVWHPKVTEDPDYHFAGILDSVQRAAAHLPRVDAIGVSSAGIYINNRTMVASLFLKVPQELFDAKVKDIYLRVAKELGDVPIEVRNDGDVTALAGAASLQDTNILGIAMGTSEAAGYVDNQGPSLAGSMNWPCPGLQPQAWWMSGRGLRLRSEILFPRWCDQLVPAAGIELIQAYPAEKLNVRCSSFSRKGTRVQSRSSRASAATWVTLCHHYQTFMTSNMCSS